MPDQTTAVSDRRLDADGRAAVLALARRIEAEDGAPPLSDQALSRIGAETGTDLTVTDGGQLIGYARVDDNAAEIAARADVAARLLHAAGAHAGGGLLVWSHGRGAVAARSGAATGGRGATVPARRRRRRLARRQRRRIRHPPGTGRLDAR
jgi:hypothetical protein